MEGPSAAKVETAPAQGDGVPKNSGRESEGATTNQLSSKPPSAGSAHAARRDSNDRWGDLPIQVREVFRTEGGMDMPPQYRDWIDGHYRRLLRQQ